MALDSIKTVVVTPTILSDIKKLRRAVISVSKQTVNTDHYIVVDGLETEESNHILNNDPFISGCHIMYTGERSDTWGAYPRQFFLDNIDTDYDYIVHLDDDNIIFSEYVEKMSDAIESSESSEASICRIIHFGPLSESTIPGVGPVNNDPNMSYVVSGNPPIERNIDTLNTMIRFPIMKRYGWVCKKGNMGYTNDGQTYQRIFKNIKYTNIDDILAVHF